VRPAAPHSDRIDSLRASIDRRIAEVKGAVVGVAFHDLGTADSLFVNADDSFHAASTMKVPVMIELFRRVDAGGLRLDQGILLVNQFGSIVDGSPYSLNAGDDSDSLAYTMVGSRVAVRELIDRMITRSSNLATNALIGSPSLAPTKPRALGAKNIQVLRGVEDGKAFSAGLNNAHHGPGLGHVDGSHRDARAASPASCAAMRDVLLRQEFNGDSAGLPKGTRSHTRPASSPEFCTTRRSSTRLVADHTCSSCSRAEFEQAVARN
jgi:beta-lactamase class A